MSDSAKDEDLMKKDLYKLLEVESTATNDEVFWIKASNFTTILYIYKFLCFKINKLELS